MIAQGLTGVKDNFLHSDSGAMPPPTLHKVTLCPPVTETLRRSAGMSRSRVFQILVIVVTGLMLTAPVLIYGIPFFSDDAVTHHAVWYVHFSEQLWAGDVYPRWLMGMNDGLGSPVFYFYPPVPFFVTSLLRPLFRNDSHGWYQLGLTASLALIASGLCAYLWLKEMVDRNSALA